MTSVSIMATATLDPAKLRNAFTKATESQKQQFSTQLAEQLDFEVECGDDSQCGVDAGPLVPFTLALLKT